MRIYLNVQDSKTLPGLDTRCDQMLDQTIFTVTECKMTEDDVTGSRGASEQ